MPYRTALLAVAAAAYLVAGGLYLWRVLRRNRRASAWGAGAAGGGAAFHAAALAVRFAEHPQAVCASVTDAASLVSFLTVVGFLAGHRLFRIEAIGSAVLPMAFAGVAVAAALPSATREVPDILRSPWFYAHVPPALLAYVSFAFSFAAAGFYLSEAKLLRSKRLAAVIGVLPSLDQLEAAMYRTATFGFLLLTIGIATGAAWAQDVGWRYWSWTPKQSASLVTWLLFAAYLHLRVIRGSRAKAGVWLVIIGFLSSIATFLAVGALKHDPHRFF
jgi:ABC-type transport system involved in cytochrome c biogenesis permease subunit